MNRKKANKMIELLMKSGVNTPEDLSIILDRKAKIKELHEEVKEMTKTLKEEKQISLEELKKNSINTEFVEIVGRVENSAERYFKNRVIKRSRVSLINDFPELPIEVKNKREVAGKIGVFLSSAFMKSKVASFKPYSLDLSTKIDLRHSLNGKLVNEDGSIEEFKLTNVLEIIRLGVTKGGVVNYRGKLYSVTPQKVFRAPWIMEEIHNVYDYIMAI